jgi:AcrR family transcriptional regulator
MQRATRSPRRPAGRGARVRRDPEETRALILDAAERLFAVRGPDAVGLKDVASEARVSHALVSHYFGTYGGLVDAVLERRAKGVRERVVALLSQPSAETRPTAVLEALWEVLTDPKAARVSAWALLSGRAESAEFFPRRVQGLRQVADTLEVRMRAQGPTRVTREDIEFLLMLSMAVTLGYALSAPVLRVALGKRPSAAADADFRARVSELVELYLAR